MPPRGRIKIHRAKACSAPPWACSSIESVRGNPVDALRVTGKVALTPLCGKLDAAAANRTALAGSRLAASRVMARRGKPPCARNRADDDTFSINGIGYRLQTAKMRNRRAESGQRLLCLHRACGRHRQRNVCSPASSKPTGEVVSIAAPRGEYFTTGLSGLARW